MYIWAGLTELVLKDNGPMGGSLSRMTIWFSKIYRDWVQELKIDVQSHVVLNIPYIDVALITFFLTIMYGLLPAYVSQINVILDKYKYKIIILATLLQYQTQNKSPIVKPILSENNNTMKSEYCTYYDRYRIIQE